MAFGRAVNVALGLPIVRTAVDHGTAFDIAGDPSAMIAGRTATARSRPARVFLHNLHVSPYSHLKR